MTTQPKALPPRAESSPVADRGPPSAPEAGPASVAVAPVDFDATALLSDEALRARACEAPDPGARLAACWRLMVRRQAVPQTAPAEGVRLLTLINLATLQDLELLEVVLCFDPCGGVRAQAAILLWRVARDRDRVVSLLLSRLRSDTSPDVIGQLLTLEPVLPPDRVCDVVRTFVRHSSDGLRRVAWRWWFDHGEPNDASMLEAIWSEPSRDLRAWCLSKWAAGPQYQSLLQRAADHPGGLDDALDALRQAARTFTVTELAPLLDRRPVWAVLGLAGEPYGIEARRLLVSLTRVLPPGRSHGARLNDALWRCLRSAYAPGRVPALTDEERAWVSTLEAELATAERQAADLEEVDYDDYDYDDDREDTLEAMRMLLRLLREV